MLTAGFIMSWHFRELSRLQELWLYLSGEVYLGLKLLSSLVPEHTDGMALSDQSKACHLVRGPAYNTPGS